MASLITNQSSGTVNLPPPFNQTLDAGDSVIVDNTPSEVAQAFGGSMPDTIRVDITNDVPSTTSELWVDPVMGNDTFPGSKFRPLHSLDAALRRVGLDANVDINLLPHPDVDGHPTEELWKMKPRTGKLRIRGIGKIVGQQEIAVTSRSDRVYEFTAAAPGWTDGEWAGWDIVVGSVSANGIQEGQPRTIVWNDSDSIVTATIHAKFPSFETISAGDTFRIERPAVAINTAPRAGDQQARHLIGGANNAGNANLFRPFDGNVIIENIEMRQPDNQSFDVFVTGNITCYGMHITADDNSFHKWVFNHATVRGGPYVGTTAEAYGQADYIYGWGISCRQRTPSNIRPGISGAQSTFDLYYAGGVVRVEDGCDFQIQSGLFDGRGTSGFPHAALYVRNSHCQTNNNIRNNLYFYNTDDGYDMETEHGYLEIFMPLRHLGTGPIARARYNGQIVLGDDPVVLGSTAGVYTAAQYGAQIRITGWDGATLGDTRCGSNTFTDRAAGAWAVGEYLDGEGSSHIYRTS